MTDLDLAVERRMQHNTKCRERNVNTCRKCMTMYDRVTTAYRQAVSDGKQVDKLSVLMKKSDVMRG